MDVGKRTTLLQESESIGYMVIHFPENVNHVLAGESQTRMMRRARERRSGAVVGNWSSSRGVGG